MKECVAQALAEDIGAGDLTAEFFINAESRSVAFIVAREDAVVSGIDVAVEAFRQVDETLGVAVLASAGDTVRAGDRVLRIEGSSRSIITAERVALNFLQRLSGVATLTRRYVDAISGTSAKILDTRKTTPGLRALEKAAVAAGGATNHRMGLFDMVMVKDNHLMAAEGLPGLQRSIDVFKAAHSHVRVELEADTLDQVRGFLTLNGVDVILLDNMSLEELRSAVALVQKRVLLEASGGVTLDTVAAIAATGVDFVSVGALTHSARAVDFSLEIVDEPH